MHVPCSSSRKQLQNGIAICGYTLHRRIQFAARGEKQDHLVRNGARGDLERLPGKREGKINEEKLLLPSRATYDVSIGYFRAASPNLSFKFNAKNTI